MTRLELRAGIGDITRTLIDVPSVSGGENEIADEIQGALSSVGALVVARDGNAIVAERPPRAGLPTIVLAGHLDTVPIADNLPAVVEDGLIRGCGAADMKGGVAVALRLAATLPELAVNVRYVFYDLEEVEAHRNGLGRIAMQRPEWIQADCAVLLEPTDGHLEAGCQGSLRAVLTVPGRRAHTARAWMGMNAIQEAAPLLARLRRYEARVVEVEGLTFREGLQAVRIDGGVAGNVVPDLCRVVVNHRYAPDRDAERAIRHLQEVFDGYAIDIEESAPPARPGLTDRFIGALARACPRPPRAKLGWTDVARFTGLGVPAINFGPGDPQLAHTPGEFVRVEQLSECVATLGRWLSDLR